MKRISLTLMIGSVLALTACAPYDGSGPRHRKYDENRQTNLYHTPNSNFTVSRVDGCRIFVGDREYQQRDFSRIDHHNDGFVGHLRDGRVINFAIPYTREVNGDRHMKERFDRTRRDCTR